MESNIDARTNRFDTNQKVGLFQKREQAKAKLQQEKEARKNKNLIKADYQTRGLDFCYYCGDKFNVGERIPRILVHCGHTFCTECLSQLHHNFRVRCPICRKLVKQLETVDKLPLNFNILYEIVERDGILRDINFEEEDCIESLLCEVHDQRIQHFYCSNHLTVFCRECIKEQHTDERCFVVDLYEIEKMRKMHRLNQNMNKKQLEKRKDKAEQSYVDQEISADQVIGDSKWFLKKKEMFLMKQYKMHEQMLLLQQQQKLMAQSGIDFLAKNPSEMQAMLQNPKGYSKKMMIEKQLAASKAMVDEDESNSNEDYPHEERRIFDDEDEEEEERVDSQADDVSDLSSGQDVYEIDNDEDPEEDAYGEEDDSDNNQSGKLVDSSEGQEEEQNIEQFAKEASKVEQIPTQEEIKINGD